MKALQRIKSAGLACTCLLATFTAAAWAGDKGIYEGEWATQSPALSLKITAQGASFTIDGKTYTDPAPEYFYGKLATAPFLYLRATEPSNNPAYAQNEHRLYLILGEDTASTQGKPKLNLRGYYDFAKLGAHSSNTVESESYPIEMQRVGEQTTTVKKG